MKLKNLLLRKLICAYCGKILKSKWIWQGSPEFYYLQDGNDNSLKLRLGWSMNWGYREPCSCKPKAIIKQLEFVEKKNRKEEEIIKIIERNCTYESRNNYKKCWWQLNDCPQGLARVIIKWLEEAK